MEIQDRYLDAVTIVLDWDLPEEGYAQAANAQACLLAGPQAQDRWDDIDWGEDVCHRAH